MVTDFDPETNLIDVMFDDDSLPDLEGFAGNKINLIVGKAPVNQLFQCQLLVEAAKCSLKLVPTASLQAVQDLSACIFLFQVLNLKGKEEKKLLFEARFLRSRAFLLLNRFRNAAIDIKAAVLLDPGHKGARKVCIVFYNFFGISMSDVVQTKSKMVDAIKQRKKRALKGNQRLARDIGNWVQKATASAAANGTMM